MQHVQNAVRLGTRSTVIGIVVNTVLAAIKGIAGVFGHSYALVADAIESLSDVVTSLVVLMGVRMAGKPADRNHPYGHGKFEPLATVVVALMLMGAAMLVAAESISEIRTPHHAPASFTLVVLALVVIVKELLFRYVIDVGSQSKSGLVQADAWHHRSDAITSMAAFVGITVALIGGPGYESADDCAALLAAAVIAMNAVLLLHPALRELVDTAPDPELIEQVRAVAVRVPGVLGTHKCHVRKVGYDYFVDLDVLCDPNATIRQGHEVAHNVGEAIQREITHITKVLVHVEPVDDFGRRVR